MEFTKMHGLGNDYIFLYCPEGEPEDGVNLARILSQQHTGIGGDGLICICPSQRADFQMVMFNADGSRGSMCGNGIRCLGKYVYDHKLTQATHLQVETGGGIRDLILHIEDGKVASVTVDMGAPQIGPRVELDVKGTVVSGIPVWIGNPHLVCEVPDVQQVELETLGPQLEYHPKLHQRVNVEFVTRKETDRIAMRVWERGSGETLACGTGASAALAALSDGGKICSEVVVELPGGELKLHRRENGHIYMTGPAVTVFDGNLAIDPRRIML